MTNELVNQEWYEHLVDECKAIITEATFNSRWALVEGYWNLGKRIEEEVRTRPINLIQLFADLQESISKDSSLFYRAHQVYLKYPELDLIPEGKNISWNKLITIYLPEQTAGEREVDIQELENHCPKCGYEW